MFLLLRDGDFSQGRVCGVCEVMVDKIIGFACVRENIENSGKTKVKSAAIARALRYLMTQRYAHMVDGSLQKATDTVSELPDWVIGE